MYLHRDNPIIRPFLDWAGTSGAVHGVAAESEYPALVALIQQFEGPESARLAEYWCMRQPEHVLVFRNAERQVVGTLFLIALEQVSTEDEVADPAVRAALRYLRAAAPLRGKERATYERSFAAAVRDALRLYPRPDKMVDLPLLKTRVVADRAGKASGPAERIEALRNLLQEASQTLEASPREAKFHRVLHRTFFSPARSQEQAAEMLDLPFSTYRRYLKTGVDQVTEWLWQREMGGSDGCRGTSASS